MLRSEVETSSSICPMQRDYLYSHDGLGGLEPESQIPKEEERSRRFFLKWAPAKMLPDSKSPGNFSFSPIWSLDQEF